MSILISNTQSTCFFLPLGLGIILYGIFQLIESVILFLFFWNSKSNVLCVGFRALSLFSLIDGCTGITAGFSQQPTLALTAAVGYAMECLTHTTLICLRYIAAFEENEADRDQRLWSKRNLLPIGGLALFLVGAMYLIRTALTYYQVLSLGGSGWEKLSPGDIIDREFGLLTMDELRRDETLREQEEEHEADYDEIDPGAKADPVYI